MTDLIPHANIVVAILIMIVGFGFHFIGQFISVLNWELACRLGLQEKDYPPDYYPYEHGTAIADSLLGWIYPIAAIGLLISAEWGYKLVWIPGVVFVYHSLSYWFWERDRRNAGNSSTSNLFRISWFCANFFTGMLAIAVAWSGYPS